jgi:hypothetical protein
VETILSLITQIPLTAKTHRTQEAARRDAQDFLDYLNLLERTRKAMQHAQKIKTVAAQLTDGQSGASTPLAPTQKPATTDQSLT